LPIASDAASAGDNVPRGRQLEYDPATGQWIESPPPVEGTSLGDLQIARQAYAREDYDDAHRRVKKWLKAYAQEPDYLPDALLLRAEVEIARRDYYKAHQHLQEYLDEYSGTQGAERALEYEFIIAEVFLSGVKRKWLGMRILSSEDTALNILDEIAAGYPDTSLAEQAVLTKARYYFSKSEFALAEMEYARLAQEFPRSRYVRLAKRRSADAAMASFPGIEFDDAALIEAEERYSEYLAQYGDPAEQEGIGQLLDQIHSQRAAKELSIGRYYEKTGHSGAAAFYYRSTCENWPDTIAATQARGHLRSMGEIPEQEAVSDQPEEPAADS
jgi:outer membrane protein assembly factor BamD (BamD/ComL family)